MNRLVIALSVLTLSVAFNGCKKDDDDDNNSSGGNNNNPPAVTVNSEPQVSFKIGATSYSYKTGTGTVTQAFTNGFNLNTFPTPSEFSFGAVFEENSEEILNFRKGFLLSQIPVDSTDFKNYFSAGAYTYVPQSGNGVHIEYFDGTDIWTSWHAPGTQSGSTFVIEDQLYQNILGEHYIRIKITFNCTVYHESGSGASLTITNGVAVMDMYCDY